jgi:hypothetical protein
MNQKLKTTKIQGKDYVEVNTRIKHFRSASQYRGWGMDTEIVYRDEKAIIIKATVVDADGKIMSTGMAMEKEGSSFINKTSHVENCETSAVGRALGNLGIGIDASVASYDEIANAKINQSKPQTPKSNFNSNTNIF